MENWKVPDNLHITVDFFGKDPQKAKDSEIYKKFKDGVQHKVKIVGALLIGERILTAITFPQTEISNEYPHMTLMHKVWKPFSSNAALASTCQMGGTFYSQY